MGAAAVFCLCIRGAGEFSTFAVPAAKRAADFRGRRRGPSALCRAGSRPKPAFFRAKEKADLRVKSEVLFSEGLPAISNVRSLVRSVLHYELLQIRDILFDLIIEESKVLGI